MYVYSAVSLSVPPNLCAKPLLPVSQNICRCTIQNMPRKYWTALVPYMQRILDSTNNYISVYSIYAVLYIVILQHYIVTTNSVHIFRWIIFSSFKFFYLMHITVPWVRSAQLYVHLKLALHYKLNSSLESIHNVCMCWEVNRTVGG